MQGAEGGREGGCPKGTKKRTLDCFDCVYVDQFNVEGVENVYGIIIEDFYADELNACADKHTRRNRKKNLRTALKNNYDNPAKKAAHISNAGRGHKVRKLAHGRKSKAEPWEPLIYKEITRLTGLYGPSTRIVMTTIACTIMEEQGNFDVTLKLGPSLNKVPAALLAEAMWSGSIENDGEETSHCGPAWMTRFIKTWNFKKYNSDKSSYYDLGFFSPAWESPDACVVHLLRIRTGPRRSLREHRPDASIPI